MVLLCDGGLAINVLSSILMNGVCCLHNLSAEEERNRQQAEELRRTINVEYERQRLFDKECRDRMRREEQLLAEKQRLVAEQLQQRRRGGGDGGMLLLCDEEHNNNNMSHAHIDTTRHATTMMSAQPPSCPRRTLMAKKMQLSSPVPVSSAAAPSPPDAASLSPRETWVNCPVDGRQKLSSLHNDAETLGRRRRYAYAYGPGWNDMAYHRGSARRGTPHQQRDDMSSSCASSTVSLLDDSSDEEA